jgi:hypothetical protein
MIRYVMAVAGLCACAALAWAQVGEISVSGGGGRLSKDLGNNTANGAEATASGGFTLGIRLTLNT